MNDFESARQCLIDDLHKYLVGPAEGEEEVIPEKASDRYHVGILWPSGSGISREEDDNDSGTDVGSGEGSSADGVFSLANASQQSAMGFTFQIPEGKPFVVEAEWAEYKPEPNDAAMHGYSHKWKRHSLSTGRLSSTDFQAENPVWEDSQLEIVRLERFVDGVSVITLTIVNKRPKPEWKQDMPPIDPNIYQVRLKVVSADGTDIFVSRPSGEHVSDPEYLVHEVLYRNVRPFAVGHGCGVDWKSTSPDSQGAAEIMSEWLPSTEVFKASSEVEALKGSSMLSLEFLVNHQKDQVLESLRELPKAYGEWIDRLEESSTGITSSFKQTLQERIQQTVDQNIAKCREVCRRLLDGITFLEKNDRAYQSFIHANDAMARSMKVARPHAEPTWRPFQLAFLLLSVPSTADPEHEDRQLLDLIWFPTGGGKTEAYLGLVAFTLFYRRIVHGETGGGTAVITRYTLRLLTMQQFERAARAVMGCEVIRREKLAALGGAPFSIGLFVGNSATPGTIKKAAELIRGTAIEKSLSTLPVAECPWCSKALNHRQHQSIDEDNGKVITRCPSKDCAFHEGIPISCVDEELYRNPPSMVIGTVDKFAMMAWKPEMGSLFGINQQYRAPSLIIQDELHLISDALGSMTGLYETAFDLLCSDNGAVPKVVGSTATIRRADKQVHAVFLRKVAQFPPSGIDHNDSFFYRQDRGNPGRRYVGVHAQGRSPKHTLARLMGTLGQSALGIENLQQRDPYWTLVTYFNSMRELGGAWVLSQDDVPKYISAMPKEIEKCRSLNQVEELTSHLPSTDIPAVLNKISHRLDSDDLNMEPVDLLLCTNMISVGVDIDRLGLMIVNGQPKTTAEYIQASSRVGRPMNSAGLVVTLYNWTRPRDRSHYERFKTYHESFYRNVEATSVTPFSARARDKALHGVFIALLRIKLSQITDSPSFNEMEALGAEINAIVETIVDRSHRITGNEDISNETREELQSILADIRYIGKDDGKWKKTGNHPTAECVMCAPNERTNFGHYETPMSMREVDPPCSVVLLSQHEISEGRQQRG